jgi:hypothetical protein
MLKLGEVKLPCDSDFEYAKNLCENDQDWTIAYSKGSHLKVLTKKNDLSPFQMIKVKVDFDDVSPELIYNVLQDGEYRSTWDTTMIESKEICYLSPCSDIGYFSLKCPKPLKNRDFVTQRCFLDYGKGQDKIIYNHSINHAKFPPTKSIVRGLSYITVSYIKALSPKTCRLSYTTQSDPGGSLPSWIVNLVSSKTGPKLVKKLHKACLKYDKWKSNNNPEYRPWANPEQLKVPKINWSDIKEFNLDEMPRVDESNLNEQEVDDKDDED